MEYAKAKEKILAIIEQNEFKKVDFQKIRKTLKISPRQTKLLILQMIQEKVLTLYTSGRVSVVQINKTQTKE